MKRIPVDPWLDAGVKGCIANIARQNFWRVQHYYDLDDLIMDGYVCWCKVRRHYPDITNVKHLQGLLKTAFHRHIHDLSKKRTRVDELAMSQFVQEDGSEMNWDDMFGAEEGAAVAVNLMRTAPQEIKMLWRFLTSEDGRRRLRHKKRTFSNGRRETTNEFLCRTLGLNAKEVDLEAMARKHFYSETPRSWEGFLLQCMKAEPSF